VEGIFHVERLDNLPERLTAKEFKKLNYRFKLAQIRDKSWKTFNIESWKTFNN